MSIEGADFALYLAHPEQLGFHIICRQTYCG